MPLQQSCKNSIPFAMALPLIPIIAAITPIVLGALELYKRRGVAKMEREANQEERDYVKLAASVEKRMKEFEDSELEQAQLVSELSANLEKVARSAESMIRENRIRIDRTEHLSWIALVAGLLSLSLAIWNLLH